MIIRQVETADVPTLAQLTRQTYADAFGHSFSAADLATHLESSLSEAAFLRAIEQDVVLVAELAGRLVGFVQFGAVSIAVAPRSAEDQEIRRLYVRGDFQSRGVGTRLMDAALDHPLLKAAENIYLDVWERNRGAQELYKRYGFEVVGAHNLTVASGLAAERDLIMVRRSRS